MCTRTTACREMADVVAEGGADFALALKPLVHERTTKRVFYSLYFVSSEQQKGKQRTAQKVNTHVLMNEFQRKEPHAHTAQEVMMSNKCRWNDFSREFQ